MSECESIDEFEVISLPVAETPGLDEKAYVIVEDMAETSQKQQYAILLESKVGYKPSSWYKDIKDWVLGKQFSEKTVISGTLLEPLSEKEILVLAPHFDPILNYKGISPDHVVWLHCEPKQIRVLNYKEMKYLQAVRSLNDRLEALPKLDWIGSLSLGSGAFLNLPDVFDHPVRVTIRYVGSLPSGELGTHIGVELLECRGRGTGNGNFQDYQLFDCSQNCGLFVTMDKLVLSDVTRPMTQQPIRQSSTDDKPLKKCDRVEAYDIDGKSVNGTVKWIGRHKEALPNGAYIVGIHTDQVIHNLKDRFPHQIALHHLIPGSKEHSSLFLPIYSVKKSEDPYGNGGAVSHGHKYDTRFPHQNRSYNPQDSLSTTIANEARRHDVSSSVVKESQKEALKKFEQRKEETRREQETMESNERRHQMQQIKNELQIGEIEGFDDTMLDRKTQEKIMKDLERQKKENHPSQISKTNTTYSEPVPAVPQSRSTVSDHQFDQQLHDNHQIVQQDLHAQGMHPQNVGMCQPHVGQQGMYPQGTPQQGMYPPPQGRPPQNMSSQYNSPQEIPNQGVPYHCMPQQDMQSQGMYQQGMSQPGMSQPGMFQPGMSQPGMSQPGMSQPGISQPGMSQPGMFQPGMPPQAAYPQDQYPQDTNMAQGLPYQQGMSQNYQIQLYNQPSNKGGWRGENHPVERQQSVEFHQILRAGTNAPSDASSSDTSQYQNTSHDLYRSPEPHRQMEAPYNLPPLEVGDAVQSGNNPVCYGTIRWIGELPGSVESIAGVEMEEAVQGATDGKHGGYQYFISKPGKGVFLRLRVLRRDDRFSDVKGQARVVLNPLGKFDLNSSIKSKTFIQPPETVVERVHTGGRKGIQGHQNSCYLDSTLYGLFAFSGAFDDLFLEEATDQIGMTIKSTLQSIVNTLRHDNVVLYDHIMILRDELDKLQHIKGLKSDEKDPEEFLNLLFKHVLNVEAFLRIKRPFGTDKEFFVQLFVEGNKHHIPNTQDLLTEMFNEQQITFAKYPLRLLLQIPRYGKKFKTFKGVIPSLELDVTTLCEQYVGKCMVCGKQGTEFCPDCGLGKQNEIKESASYFCRECVGLWHNHEKRRHHKPVSRQSSSDGGDPGRLRLLSVLCIETSHYVCFTRVQGSGTNEWVFFDSMAERPDDVHNIPCVTQCTQELNEWVYGTKDLTNYTSKELPQLVRRFVEDGYLCIYVDQDGIMYGDDGGTP